MARRHLIVALTTGLAFSFGAFQPTRAQSPLPDGSTIVIVRHADKRPGDGDVALTPAGETRAKTLRDSLRATGISAIVTTNAKRTKQTAQPLAEAATISPIAVDSNAVEKTIREKLPAAVLVVGHSNTVPDLVRALGGPSVDVAGYDNLFILVRSGGTTRFIRGRYGAPSSRD